jgi:hypothetical protein
MNSSRRGKTSMKKNYSATPTSTPKRRGLQISRTPIQSPRPTSNSSFLCRIKWLDNGGEGKNAKLISLSIPPYESIDFARRPRPKSVKGSSAKPIVKPTDG